MKHFALPKFWRCYAQLPKEIQEQANKNYRLLKSDPYHNSLQFKRVGRKNQLWSVRVGLGFRALGLDKPEGVLWFWIGSHAEYDELIRK